MHTENSHVQGSITSEERRKTKVDIRLLQGFTTGYLSVGESAGKVYYNVQNSVGIGSTMGQLVNKTTSQYSATHPLLQFIFNCCSTK